MVEQKPLSISWRKIEGNYWKPENPGEQIQGILLDKINRGDDLGMQYIIEIDCKPTVFYGSVQLDEKLQYIKSGQLIRITFDGKIKHPKDIKKTIKQFTVEVAEGFGIVN